MNVTNYHKFIVRETASHRNFLIDLDIKLTTNKIDYFMVAEQRSCLFVRTRVRTVWLGLIFHSIASKLPRSEQIHQIDVILIGKNEQWSSQDVANCHRFGLKEINSKSDAQ